jgi:hypothetical protein
MSEVTRTLSEIEGGDPPAVRQLWPVAYDELRELAARKLARERPGQTHQPTALAHEAYVRLVGEHLLAAPVHHFLQGRATQGGTQRAVVP